LAAVYINIFSCKDFDSNYAAGIARDWFNGKIVQKLEVIRR